MARSTSVLWKGKLCNWIQVHEFLEAFVEEFKLRPLIRFGTRIVDVTPVYPEEQHSASLGLLRKSTEATSAPSWVVTSESASTSGRQVRREMSESVRW